MDRHPTREEDFDLYALGTLEGDEKQAIETHLASCSICAQRLAEARGRIGLLAFSAPEMAPSPNLKARLMARVRAESGAAWSNPAPHKARAAGGFFRRWSTAALVPVGVALAATTIFLWTQNRRIDQQLAALRADLEEQQQQFEQARQVAELITAPDTKVIPLAAQPGMPKGAAQVMYNQKMGMLMYEGELEPAPSDKSYQLWLVPVQGNPISAGVFTPGSDRANHFMVKLPPGITPGAFAVTLEPAGGRLLPTGPKVLVGAVS
jgi:anti-sigma-K factor RskA